jgi:hypothetical protein
MKKLDAGEAEPVGRKKKMRTKVIAGVAVVAE